MIGVIAQENQHAAVREFFELFKTPWEFYRPGLACDVLLCPVGEIPESSARCIISYGAGKTGAAMHWPVAIFAEVERLLTHGQPPAQARVATIEQYIEELREMILAQGVPLVEIPPRPAGFEFVGCLTHDVDHPRLRDHFGDHTQLGFIYRALIGSVRDWFRGRKTLRAVLQNYFAVARMPFLYAGLVLDFWNQFAHYRAIEGDARSTFFVIPRQGDPGRGAPAKRAAAYRLTSLREELAQVATHGGEIGVHGLDAWCDAEQGRAELAAVRAVGRGDESGVRMHWLYFSEESPRLLEAAGYSYDSTFGYNEAVGFRAGTTQVFKPLQTQHLLELPLNLMDTALYYPDRMNLAPAFAQKEIAALLETTTRFGGVLTVNWHDRSLAPERLWVQSYVDLIAELKRRRAWLPTAANAVAWFRARRSAKFQVSNGVVRVSITGDEKLPAFRLRIHQPAMRHGAGSEESSYTDSIFMHTAECQLNPATSAQNAA